MRESDTIARLGGDEFVVIFPEVVASSHLARVAQAIVDSLAKPFNLDENSARISASIDIAIYPRDADNQESLIECADQAMYTAKGLGRNRFSFFTQSVQEPT